MEYDKAYISKLLSLYEEGETTLDQEKELKMYFTSEHYDSDFEVYATLFKFFETESNTQFDEELKTEKNSPNFLWMNIAASIFIVLGVLWFYNYYDNQKELKEARLAFETTQNALNLLSNTMNEGLEKLEYVEIFSTQKNKLIK